MKLNTLQKYIDKIYLSDKIQTFIKTHSKSKLKPKIYISDTCGSDTAGQIWCAKNYIDIELSSWILVDKKQTLAVIRHELAHAIAFLCRLGGTNHGKEFNQALKLTAPKTFRRDRHWGDTKAIYRERKKHHPKTTFR